MKYTFQITEIYDLKSFESMSLYCPFDVYCKYSSEATEYLSICTSLPTFSLIMDIKPLNKRCTGLNEILAKSYRVMDTVGVGARIGGKSIKMTSRYTLFSIKVITEMVN